VSDRDHDGRPAAEAPPNSCRRVTQLASEALDRELSWRERLRLRVHLAYCAGCRRFAAQLGDLRRIVKRLG
jgi:predicted anti-sigma-YlaC factor YlaD